jgi:hypothetical protein
MLDVNDISEVLAFKQLFYAKVPKTTKEITGTFGSSA